MYDLYEGKIQIYPYKVFHVNEKKYIITNAASAIFEIDDMIMDLISCSGLTEEEVKNTLEERYGEDQLKDLIQNLTDNYVIKSNENVKTLQKIERDLPVVNSVTLMVCQECNLRCSYCFGEGGEYKDKGKMSYETGKEAIKFGFENSNQDSLSIVFFGGEPLIQFELIKKWVTYSNEEASKRNKKVSFAITTNATLVTDEVAKLFKENNFNVTISIDGDKEDNDKNRFYSSMRGAYDNIIRGVQKLQQYNVNVVARGTVTSKNINMMKNWKHLISLGFKSVHFAPAVNLLQIKDLIQYDKEDKRMVDYFFECLRKKDYKSLQKMHNVENYLNRIHNGGMRFTCCGAYVRMIAVDIKGDIYPCHRFVAMKDMCIGNIYSGWSKEICEKLRKDLYLSNSSCTSCWAVNLCGGGCPFENYAESKSIRDPSSFTCSSNKKLIDYIITKYLELDENERNYFFGKYKNEITEDRLLEEEEHKKDERNPKCKPLEEKVWL